MGILQFNKSYGENKPFNADDAEAMQKEIEWKKFTKDIENRIHVLDSVSIIKK
ncbi:hypothetical protein KFD70_22930 [Bacillus pfraonensis]|uniref:hypothetical protein n=1 Tax=Bacillus TaxID=1386 RepID=UPI002A50CC20|nr:hypothetical protein [Bacillus pseudomycoides]